MEKKIRFIMVPAGLSFNIDRETLESIEGQYFATIEEVKQAIGYDNDRQLDFVKPYEITTMLNNEDDDVNDIKDYWFTYVYTDVK